MRTCVGCRRRLPAGELVRVRLGADGSLVTGTGPGRGAWVGPSPACLALAVRRRALARGLRAEVNAAAVARLAESWPPEPAVCPHTGA